MMRFGNIFFVLMGLCALSFSSARVDTAPHALQRYEFQHPQMGTEFRLVFYAEQDSLQALQIAQTIFARVDTLNAIFSDWIPESEVNKLCQKAAPGQKLAVSPELFDILQQSLKFSKQTEGAFDVTVGPLTRLWRRSRSLKELPREDRLADAKSKVGWKNVVTYKKGRLVQLKIKNMGIDLGGIAQGWAADECLKLLQQQGIFSALVDAGGDIALGLAPPGETGWQISVPAPDGLSEMLYLQQCGITTSGATYRFLELNGKRYSHIVDPRTGAPLTHRTLVTIQAPNATTADAWATAISVLGEKGRSLAQKSPDKLKVWLTEMSL